jgi:two-component system, sensor histidine kinase PdtaS
MLLVNTPTDWALAQNITYTTPNPGKMQYAIELEEKAQKDKDSLLLAEAYYLYGKIYAASSDLVTAQNYFLKSRRILEPRGPSFELGRLYLRLSELSAGEEAAIQLVRRSLAICEAAGSEKGAMNARKRLVEFKVGALPVGKNGKLSPGLFKEVFSEYTKIRKYYEVQHDTLGVAELNLLIGSLLLEQHRNGASDYLNKASESFRLLNKKRQMANCQLLLAKVRLASGDKKQAADNLRLAELYYNQDEYKELYIEHNFAETYIEYYRALEDWRKVADWQLKLSSVSNKIAEADRHGAISRLNLEYQTELKEAKLKAQTNEIALKNEDLWYRNAYLLALSVLLAVALASGAGYYRLSEKYKRISNKNAQLVHEQNHRVKNNLQLVSSLLYLQASRMSDETARLAVEESQLRIEVMGALQRKLYESEQLTSVDMQSFLTEIAEMALDTFGYAYQIEKVIEIPNGLELPPDPAMRVGLIVNELITNACKHAFPTVAGPLLYLSFFKKAGVFFLRVADNGTKTMEIPSRENLPGFSFGLRFILLQVEQLFGTHNFENKNGTAFNMQFKV